jgi:hypothetical protein
MASEPEVKEPDVKDPQLPWGLMALVLLGVLVAAYVRSHPHSWLADAVSNYRR